MQKRYGWKYIISIWTIAGFLLNSSTSCLAGSDSGIFQDVPRSYEAAQKFLDAGRFKEARNIFSELNAYQESMKYVIYLDGKIALNEGRLVDAELSFSVLAGKGFLDSAQLMEYVQARKEEAYGNLAAALALYEKLDVLDSVKRQVNVKRKVQESGAEPGVMLTTPSPSYTPIPSSTPDLTPAVSPPHDASQGIVFADPAFEAMLREALGRPEGAIFLEELEGYTEITIWRNHLSLSYKKVVHDFDNGEIKVLDDLQCFPSLESLGIYSQSIDNLAPLSSLTRLYTLGLGNNEISDLTPLSGLTGLTSLDLHSNEISDLTPLSGLIGLTSLDLHSNEISDLMPLSGLTGLTSLDLFWNKISKLTPLSGLTGLTSLSLAMNEISDLTPLSGLTGLTSLSLAMNEISDLTPLSGLTGLTLLNLSWNKISKLTPLSGLTGLTWLHLGTNKISKLAPLSSLKALTHLDVTGNSITDWSPVKHVPTVVGRP